MECILLKTHEQAQTLIEQAYTKTGLKVMASIMEKVYGLGRVGNQKNARVYSSCIRYGSAWVKLFCLPTKMTKCLSYFVHVPSSTGKATKVKSWIFWHLVFQTPD